MEKNSQNWSKFLIIFLATFLVRLLPFRAPNLEPILAIQMPFARIFGGVASFAFAFFSIVIHDSFTAGLGVWTIVSATVYGAMGLWAVQYFKNKKNSSLEYAKFAIMSTLVFDAVTGLSVGPLAFGQSFSSAFFGQIPFTLLHLAGNVSFAFILSPAIYNFIINKEKREVERSFNVLNPQKV